MPDFTPRDPADVDLRRVGAHPDHWYPLAWSRELKPGRSLRRALRRRPDRAGAAQGRPGVRPGGPLRPPAGAAVQGHGRRLRDPLRLPRLDLRRRRRVHRRALSRDKGKLPNGVRAYPCQEQDGLIFIWPGDPAAVTPLPTLGSVADPAFKTRRFGQRGRLPLQLHAREPDGHEPPVPAPPPDGPDGAALPRRAARRGWLECDYTFARTGGRQPLGEAAILGSRRGASTSRAT